MALRHEFLGGVVFRTAKAVLFQDHFWEGPEWMPLSQIQLVQDAGVAEYSVKASQWICTAKGIREFEYRSNPPEELADEDLSRLDELMQQRRVGDAEED